MRTFTRSGTTATRLPTTASSGLQRYRMLAADIIALLKPRVMSLSVFTAFVGMYLAPVELPARDFLAALICIALGAGGAGALNMWYDHDIDGTMYRTRQRPVPAGRLPPHAALAVGSSFTLLSVSLLMLMANALAALLLLVTVLYYVAIYTAWLKRRTPHSVEIGGLAGALPPLIGWAAATGGVDWLPLVLCAIIFLWTPPHSWALALLTAGDYHRGAVPTLPLVRGTRHAKKLILRYVLALLPVTAAPMLLGSGPLYAVAAIVLNTLLIKFALALCSSRGGRAQARQLFFFSITYLFLLFAALALDRALRVGTLPL